MVFPACRYWNLSSLTFSRKKIFLRQDLPTIFAKKLSGSLTSKEMVSAFLEQQGTSGKKHPHQSINVVQRSNRLTMSQRQSYHA